MEILEGRDAEVERRLKMLGDWIARVEGDVEELARKVGYEKRTDRWQRGVVERERPGG